VNLQKRRPIRSTAIRKAAEGECCCVCGSTIGVSLCHLNESWGGKGMGQKADDIAGFFGCQNCHDQYDRRTSWKSSVLNDALIMRAMYRTMRRLWEKGVITIKDCEP
jgi:hypothetical protein